MKALGLAFEKLRLLVYAFFFAMSAGIGAGLMAGDIDQTALYLWMQSRAVQVVKLWPTSNVLHQEAIRRYEQTVQQHDRQTAPKASSLDALKQRQQIDLLRAEKARQQEIVDGMHKRERIRTQSRLREVVRP